MKTKTLPLKHSTNRAPFRRALLLMPFALACFALVPQARAVCREGCDLHNFNTFLGADALTSNTTGTENTATGAGALTFNTTGFDNTATGSAALYLNTTGYGNTATGEEALFLNTTGSSNTAVGLGALLNNATGGANTAVGVDALRASTGNNNVALGFLAGQNLTGDNNIAVGYLGGQYLGGDNNIDIGNQGGADDSGTIRFGTEGTHTATYIAGIRQTPLVQGMPMGVAITAAGQLGVRPSSARFKEAIKPMDTASEAVLALKPVTFRYKNDPAALPQFGLVAEEVAKVNPDLVARDKEGKPFTVRYEEINAMLLNEFLKEHRTVQELKCTVAKQEETILQRSKDFQAIANQQQKQIEALTAGLQKVSAQLEASKPVLQTIVNNQ